MYEYNLRDGGDNTVVDTLLLMSKYALIGRDNLRIILLTRKITQTAKENDKLEEARRIYEFVKKKIKYISDPLGHEMIVAPNEMLEIRQGDCDGKCTLIAAMLFSIGIPARFVAIQRPAKKSFSHVYVEAEVFGKWIPMDASGQYNQFGIAPPSVKKITMPAQTYALKNKNGVTMKYDINRNDIEYIEIPDNVAKTLSDYNLSALSGFNINEALNSGFNIINSIGNVLGNVAETTGAASAAIGTTVPQDQAALEKKLKELAELKRSAEQTTKWYNSPATWLTVGGVGLLSVLILLLPKNKGIMKSRKRR